MKELNQKLALVQTKLKAKKSSYNSFGKYYFRKSEDILEAVKPFLLELDVSVVIKEQIIATEPVPMLESTAIFSDGESQVTATAVVGVDLSQKGMQTSQQFGAASTYGKKYALGNLFLIDDTEDADATNTHGKAPAKAVVAPVAKPQLKINSEAYLKAIQAVTNKQVTIAQVKAKYDLDTVVLGSLLKASKSE